MNKRKNYGMVGTYDDQFRIQIIKERVKKIACLYGYEVSLDKRLEDESFIPFQKNYDESPLNIVYGGLIVPPDKLSSISLGGILDSFFSVQWKEQVVFHWVLNSPVTYHEGDNWEYALRRKYEGKSVS